MKVPYVAIPVLRPVPSLAGSRIRYRPIMAVLITGPSDARLYDGLLDTGADDTIFDEALAALIGVDLHQAEERLVGLAGRTRPVKCRYAPVRLRVSDGVSETYEWTAVVGFVPGPLHYNLLGQSGFLQYFSADFDGDARVVTLTVRGSFPGRRI